MSKETVTILHLSDLQFGKDHRFGRLGLTADDSRFDTLLNRITEDLQGLKSELQIAPDLLVLTGDLAEQGMKREFDDVQTFVQGLSERLGLAPERVAIVPGNHDINRKACEAYFNNCEADGEEPKPPFFPKWRHYAAFLKDIYKDSKTRAFVEEQPWNLLVIDELKLVIACLNSTMSESHRDPDHHGWLGEAQLRWFKQRLARYKQQGWFRLALMHHNPVRGAVDDDANLRDSDDLFRILSDSVNLILHGHTHHEGFHWLSNKLPVLGTGSAAVTSDKRPSEVPNQYQVIRVSRDRIWRGARCYAPDKKRWIGDTRVDGAGNNFYKEERVEFDGFRGFVDERKAQRPEPKRGESSTAAVLDEEIKVYLDKCLSLHGSIHLAGFETRVRVPIELEELYVPLMAMVDLDVRDNGLHKPGRDTELFEHHEKSKAVNLIDGFGFARDYGSRRGLVILGEPGSGKTTQLKRLLIAVAKQGAEKLGLPADTLPVFLPLRHLGDAKQKLSAFMDSEFEACQLELSEDFGRRLVKRGRMLFLLDGLDEISKSAEREQVSRWIETLIRAMPDSHFVVTCRYAGYTDAVRLSPDFLELHLSPLDDKQANAFIHNWFSIVESSLASDKKQARHRAQQAADELIERLKQPDIRATRVFALTRNPLLLTTICLVHRDRGELPHRRAELYDECVNILLEHWRKAKKLDVSVPAKRARAILQPVALWMHQQAGRDRATAAELEPVIAQGLSRFPDASTTAKEFLISIRDESGLLTGWSADSFGFMHLGFQEYLAARELRTRGFDDPGVLKQLAGHFQESWWHEVMLLLVALEEPFVFERFMRFLLKQRGISDKAALVRECVEDSSQKSERPFIELLEQDPATDEELWSRQMLALRVLSRLESSELARLSEKLKTHPSPEIRSWLRGESSKAEQRVIHAERGGYELVMIPGGVFKMGSPETEEGRSKEEGPVHRVEVPSFYLGRYPVTNEQYGRFLAENSGMREPAYWADREYNQPQQPVVGVSWEDARRYAEWAGLRLPSEAEWEYACRAGTRTCYYSGDSEADLDRVGWYRSNSNDKLHPVGEKEPNTFGLYDMHGNVWEWVEDDWRDDYRGAPTDGSAWIEKPRRGGGRAVRGGGSLDSAKFVRSAFRSFDGVVARINGLGFRLARSYP